MSPVNATNLQAAWGSGFVTVLPAGGYVWTIRSSDTGFTCVLRSSPLSHRCRNASFGSIQDGGVTVFWGTDNATDDATVTIGGGTGNEKQRWIFQKSG